MNSYRTVHVLPKASFQDDEALHEQLIETLRCTTTQWVKLRRLKNGAMCLYGDMPGGLKWKYKLSASRYDELLTHGRSSFIRPNPKENNRITKLWAKPKYRQLLISALQNSTPVNPLWIKQKFRQDLLGNSF